MIIGGDGRVLHDDCDPADAVGDLSGPDGDQCWVCGEDVTPVEEDA